MRNQWRSLLRRSVGSSSFQSPTTTLQALKVFNRSFSRLSSYLGRNIIGNASNSDFSDPSFRSFSSESILQKQPNEFEHTQVSNNVNLAVVTEIISESSSNEEIKKLLASSNIKISHKKILNILENLAENPKIAWKFFSFLLEMEKERLSSQTYDLMLAILCRKDYVEQFCHVMRMMKKKGYRVTKRTYDMVLNSSMKEEFADDLGEFKEMYGSNTNENSIGSVCSKVCRLIRKTECESNLRTELSNLDCNWSSTLVVMTIEHLSMDPMKALMFFSWVKENPCFKHNKLSYSAMVKVLAREDSISKFWRIFEEMKEAGYQMDMDLYTLVLNRFYKRKMIRHAVDLYECMMSIETKPSVEDFDLLLQKIILNTELDLDLFARAVKMFTDCRGSLAQSSSDLVLRSLSSAGRSAESGKILNVMENGGLVPKKEVYNRVIYQLSSVGKSEEAFQIMNKMEASGCTPDVKTWYSLIHGQCIAFDVEKASSSFRSMVEKFGVADARDAFQVLMKKGFFREKKPEDAYKFFSEMVDVKELRPLESTYKMLIDKLLISRRFNEALSLLSLMKGNGYPPYLQPFIGHISKSGTGTDAMRFLGIVTDTTCPSNSVFLSVFKAFFRAGRHSEAQKLLSECPSYICSDADVLNLFRAPEPVDAVASAVAAQVIS